MDVLSQGRNANTPVMMAIGKGRRSSQAQVSFFFLPVILWVFQKCYVFAALEWMISCLLLLLGPSAAVPFFATPTGCENSRRSSP